MNRHEHLVEMAKNAINAVFGDKSVSPSATLESMRELEDCIASNIEALHADGVEDS